jgi:hypothetical protein
MATGNKKKRKLIVHLVGSAAVAGGVCPQLDTRGRLGTKMILNLFSFLAEASADE